MSAAFSTLARPLPSFASANADPSPTRAALPGAYSYPQSSVSVPSSLHPTGPTARHYRNHSAGASSSPTRRSPFSSLDDESDPTHSPPNGNVAVHIRSRAWETNEGRAARPVAGHGRSASDEDARGLKKGRRAWLRRGVPSLVVLLALCGLCWLGWSLRPHDPRSRALSLVVPFLPLSSTVTSQLSAGDHLVFAAIASWLVLLRPEALIVYTQSSEACTVLTSLFKGVQCFHLPQCVSLAPPLPELPCVLTHTLSLPDLSSSTLLLFSSPLAIGRSFLEGVHYVHANLAPEQRQRWLMVGARTDISLTGMAAREWASEGFADRLFMEAKARGTRHADHAMDALVMSHGMLSWLMDEGHLPSFVAGAGHWTRFVFVQAMLERSCTVLDMTLAVQLLHLQLVGGVRSEDDFMIVSPMHTLRKDADHLHDRDNAGMQLPVSALAHNHELMRSHLGVRQALGSMAYAPLILEGDCPDACIISPNPDTRGQSAILFTQRVNTAGYLAVLTVNSGYLALAQNWLCWAERIGFTNFILLAEDQHAAETLASPAVPVITKPQAPYQKEAAAYGSVEFQDIMTYRTEFLLEVLDVGYHFMTADMDAIWLSDPFVHVDPAADLSGQTHKRVKLSGGLVIVRATDAGKAFWKDVIKCQRNNAKFLAEHQVGSYEPSLYTEQYCINQLYIVQPPPPAFTRTLLDPWLFPDGLSFFEQQQPQHAGVLPVIIHNNWIRGTEAKLKRMRDWGLTSTDDFNTHCATIPAPPPPVFSASTSSETGFSLIIRVIARSSPVGLTALLEQLGSLQCLGCGSLTLQIDVDRLPELDDQLIEQTVARHATYVQLLDIAQKFVWKQGDKLVREGKRRRGRLGQWLDGWPLKQDERVLSLLLDEQVQLSPELYRWLSIAVQRYYLSDDVDSRMIGIQLEREELVLGESYWSRWPTRLTSSQLLPNESVYRYQSVSPYAQLVFPSAMQRFTSWIDARWIDHVTSLPPATTNKHVTPCIPLLISNQWYLPQGDTQLALHYETEDVWWVWMQRWMYEEGLYSLLTSFNGREALAVHPLGKHGPFLNDTAQLLLSAALLHESRDALLSFPPLASLPLFSFGFSRVSPSSLLSVLPRLSPAGLSVQCYSASSYVVEQRQREEAEAKQRKEDELRARAAAEAKAKKILSDAMKREKRKVEKTKAQMQEEQEKERPFAVELEGG